MSDSTELQGEEAPAVSTRSRKRFVLLIFIPAIVAIGGVIIWLMLSTAEDVVEEPIEELEEIAAATAPPIVPQTSEPTIDVPAVSDATTTEDLGTDGPLYIPPEVADVPSYTEPLDVPVIDPFQTTPYDEQRSRLQDALNASPVVDIQAIVAEEEESASVGSTPEQGSLNPKRYTLTPGAVIPSVLVQGINTDLPGIAVAQVSRNVYDSRTGARLLIPRGSRIFGTYGTDQQLSDQRVLVSWERIDLPNGKAIELERVIGADQSGNAGLSDQVHRRTGQALTVTGLTSLITAGLTYAAETKDPEVLQETSQGRFVQEPSYTGGATREIAEQYGNIVGQIAQRHLDQGPTLTIRPGYEFAIQIAEEISLTPYIH